MMGPLRPNRPGNAPEIQNTHTLEGAKLQTDNIVEGSQGTETGEKMMSRELTGT